MEDIIKCWRKDHFCQKVAKNLAGLCSSVLWKVDFVNEELRYLAEISKHNVEGVS